MSLPAEWQVMRYKKPQPDCSNCGWIGFIKKLIRYFADKFNSHQTKFFNIIVAVKLT
jgi:hypothetical protein